MMFGVGCRRRMRVQVVRKDGCEKRRVSGCERKTESLDGWYRRSKLASTVAERPDFHLFVVRRASVQSHDDDIVDGRVLSMVDIGLFIALE